MVTLGDYTRIGGRARVLFCIYEVVYRLHIIGKIGFWSHIKTRFVRVRRNNIDSTIYLVAFYELCRIWPASDVRCRPTGVCTFSSTAERPSTISLVCARCDC